MAVLAVVKLPRVSSKLPEDTLEALSRLSSSRRIHTSRMVSRLNNQRRLWPETTSSNIIIKILIMVEVPASMVIELPTLYQAKFHRLARHPSVLWCQSRASSRLFSLLQTTLISWYKIINYTYPRKLWRCLKRGKPKTRIMGQEVHKTWPP